MGWWDTPNGKAHKKKLEDTKKMVHEKANTWVDKRSDEQIDKDAKKPRKYGAFKKSRSTSKLIEERWFDSEEARDAFINKMNNSPEYVHGNEAGYTWVK
jgi:hypothetical protein